MAMDETRRAEIDLRWRELHRQLQDLMEGKIGDGDEGLEDRIQEEIAAIEEELRAGPGDPRSDL